MQDQILRSKSVKPTLLLTIKPAVSPKRREALILNEDAHFDIYEARKLYNNSSSVSSKGSSNLTPRSKMHRNMEILEELGFGSYSSNRPVFHYLPKDRTEKKISTIGISDFWTYEYKLKYLKHKGFWNAYKKILYQKHKIQYESSKSPHSPNSPYIMDINTYRLANSPANSPCPRGYIEDKLVNRLSFSKTVRAGSKSPNEKLKTLEDIHEKCNKLIKDTRKVKDIANRIYNKAENKNNQHIKEKINAMPKKLAKIDHFRIQSLLNAMPH